MKTANLRREESNLSMPVAGPNGSTSRLKSYQLGVNAYVVKPVDFHEFVNGIRELGIFWAIINEPPPGSMRKQS